MHKNQKSFLSNLVSAQLLSQYIYFVSQNFSEYLCTTNHNFGINGFLSLSIQICILKNIYIAQRSPPPKKNTPHSWPRLQGRAWKVPKGISLPKIVHEISGISEMPKFFIGFRIPSEICQGFLRDLQSL